MPEVTADDVVIAYAALKSRHTRPPKDPNKKYPYRLIPFEDLRPGTKSAYIVDGVIPTTGIVAVWGPPKCGKSFWTFDLTMHIALGWKYRDLDVEQGPVAYLAFEGAEGFNNRAEAFRRTHAEALERRLAYCREHGLPEEIWFHLLPSNAKLVRDHEKLIESIDGQVDRPPTVVVLDTLNRSIDGSESKDADMGAYLAAAEVIADAFYCVVIIVHHCGVDDTRPRGHTSLPGAVAAQIAIKRNAAGHITAEVEAMKDGAEGASFTSALKLVEVGTSDKGKPITSCAIIPVEGDAAAKAKGRPKLPAAAKLALEQLTELIADVGECPAASNHIPPNIKVVSVALWREHFYNTHPADKPDTKQKAFVRAASALQNARLIGIWNDKAWLAGHAGHSQTFSKCPGQSAVNDLQADEPDTGGVSSAHSQTDRTSLLRDVRMSGAPGVRPSASFVPPLVSYTGEDEEGERQPYHGSPFQTVPDPPPKGSPCVHCGKTDGKILMVTEPGYGKKHVHHPLHMECAAEFFAKPKPASSGKKKTRAAKPKSDDMPYTGPPVDVPDMGADSADDHGTPLASDLTQGSLREHADWYRDETQRRYNENKLDTPALDADLRARLRKELKPDRVEAAFEEVMELVWAV
jgi:hypothetical protein